MKQITVRVDNELVGALDRAAERLGRTRAAVVRVAIDQFVGAVGDSDGVFSAERREMVPRNPYARTRPTPLRDRERDLHERTIRRATEKERDLLARMEGRFPEDEPAGSGRSQRAPRGTKRAMLEAFGPVEPPGGANGTIEEYREWLRAPFPDSP